MNKYIIRIFVFTITAIIFNAAFLPAYAQKSSNKLWRQIDEKNLQDRENSQATPEKYLVFRLNETALKNSLADLPLENTDAAEAKNVIMEIPMPDGSLQRFKMEETSVLSPELAGQYPDWKSFVGYGIDDKSAIGRFDWNALGFHGYIETDHGIVFIDPYSKGDTNDYLVFYKHEFGRSNVEFYDREEVNFSKLIRSDYQAFVPDAPEFAFGARVRTYRLAVATTGEFARNAAGAGATTTQQIRDGALAVIMTAVNHLNGIYTRELASQFQLVNPPTSDNTRNIIFDDPTNDPYDNTDNTAQLTINNNTLNNRVGTTNYDIGHLFGTGGGGVASSPSLCSSQKGEGYSARGTETGDPFVVDYVAHEIGHQFGANHTYNNADSSGTCTTRSAANAFEVASGSTIMSYVGICEMRNLQQFNDFTLPAFHIRSMTEINDNLNDPNGDPQQTGCGTLAAGANNIPTINAGASFTIPRLTPFTLTATGNDADANDVSNLLYSWEEYDLAPSASGVAGTPPGTYDVDSDGVLRPLFRAYSPVGSNQRTFPSLTFILNPANNDPAGSNQPPLTYTGTHPTGKPGAVCETGMTCVVGERLPTVSRTMNYRVSLRDRRGGVADAGTTVTIAGGAGPFQVTTQNSSAANFQESFAASAPAATWQTGTTQTVTWDVANTNAAPVNTANVNILLSTDGGQTFPITLAANTANDGSEQITVPNNPTMAARIKVEAVGNIFFDINNANFAITAPTAASVSVSGRVFSSFGRGISNVSVTITDQYGNRQTARTNSFGYYRFSEIESGQTYVLNASHKRYKFAPRVVAVTDYLVGFDLFAKN